MYRVVAANRTRLPDFVIEDRRDYTVVASPSSICETACVRVAGLEFCFASIQEDIDSGAAFRACHARVCLYDLENSGVHYTGYPQSVLADSSPTVQIVMVAAAHIIATTLTIEATCTVKSLLKLHRRIRASWVTA